MSQLRRWVLKKLIGSRMIVANVHRDTDGTLWPMWGQSGGLIYDSWFCGLDGTTILERTVDPENTESVLSFHPGTQGIVIEDCVFFSS